MEVKGKMPDNVKTIRFLDSQNECEVVLQYIGGSGRAASSTLGNNVARRQPKWRCHSSSATEGVLGDDQPDSKRLNPARCSAALAIEACRVLSTKHHEILEEIGLSAIACMTLDFLEKPDLIRWLIGSTNPDTMCISIDEDQKIQISPRTLRLVMGTPLGGNDIILAPKKVVLNIHDNIT
uniref:Uncharacterized protein n=1 Tax=Oryza brachyantha TaxID=4533 RepID=J3MKE8_ORYBR